MPFRIEGNVEGVETIKLDVGDYGVRYRDGVRPPVYFERKAIGDLWGTMTHDYPRWKRELKRAREAGVTLILIIEGSLTDVGSGWIHSGFPGPSMEQKLFTIQVRYSLPIVFSNNRLEMARYIVEYFSAIGREYVAMKKLEARGETGQASSHSEG